MGRITENGFAVNVYWNADNGEWNCNANRLDDNRWNADNRAFTQLNSVLPQFDWGSFDSNPFFHPPSIRPTSCRDSLMVVYF